MSAVEFRFREATNADIGKVVMAVDLNYLGHGSVHLRPAVLQFRQFIKGANAWDQWADIDQVVKS